MVLNMYMVTMDTLTDKISNNSAISRIIMPNVLKIRRHPMFLSVLGISRIEHSGSCRLVASII